jgi:nucleoside-diphosphate-sugar epimerase
MAAATLITGANRGLGFEFASQYLAEGWRVFVACHNPDAAKLRCLAQDMLNVVAMDVTDAESVLPGSLFCSVGAAKAPPYRPWKVADAMGSGCVCKRAGRIAP